MWSMPMKHENMYLVWGFFFVVMFVVRVWFLLVLVSSSFMKWWNEYKGIVKGSLLLLDFMNNSGPDKYEAGRFT